MVLFLHLESPTDQRRRFPPPPSRRHAPDFLFFLFPSLDLHTANSTRRRSAVRGSEQVMAAYLMLGRAVRVPRRFIFFPLVPVLCFMSLQGGDGDGALPLATGSKLFMNPAAPARAPAHLDRPRYRFQLRQLALKVSPALGVIRSVFFSIASRSARAVGGSVPAEEIGQFFFFNLNMRTHLRESNGLLTSRRTRSPAKTAVLLFLPFSFNRFFFPLARPYRSRRSLQMTFRSREANDQNFHRPVNFPFLKLGLTHDGRVTCWPDPFSVE